MKCQGLVKKENKRGQKITALCGHELEETAIFCPVCGEPTAALKTGLSAYQNLKESWNTFMAVKGKFLGFAVFMILVPLLINIAGFLLVKDSYLQTNLFLLFSLPLLLIPFSLPGPYSGNPMSIKSYLRHLAYYPNYLFFIFLSILYFFVLKVVCTGFLLNLATDPILNLVRLILIIYWLVIISPAPLLMARKKINPVQAVITCYQAGDQTRWQQFYLLLCLLLINILGAALAGLGLLVTLPFTYFTLEKYFLSMKDYKLFDIKAGRYRAQAEKKLP